MAVDGSGNVYVVSPDTRVVYRIPISGGYTTVDTLADYSFNIPYGVAVDGTGNLYVSTQGNRAVYKTPAANGYTTANALPPTLSNPYHVAVDRSGNVYVAAEYFEVNRILAAGGYTRVNSLGSRFYRPGGVAVDGSGNVYVADTGNNAVKQILAADGYTTVNTLSRGFNQPFGVAVDGSGNVYVADTVNDAVKQIALSQAPSLTFYSVRVGDTSYPRAETITNTGNMPLTFPVSGSGNNPSIAPHFSLDSSGATACPVVSSSSSSPGSLAAGTSCTFSLNFVPQLAGSISGTLVLTDTSLNASTLHTIQLSATADKAYPRFTKLIYPTITYGAPSVTLSGVLSAGTTQYPPTGEVSATIYGLTQTTTIGAYGAFSLDFPTSSIPYSANGYLITYSYAGDANFSSSNYRDRFMKLRVNKATPSVTTWQQPERRFRLQSTDLATTYTAEGGKLVFRALACKCRAAAPRPLSRSMRPGNVEQTCQQKRSRLRKPPAPATWLW